MAATPEKKVKDKVVKLLKQYGAYYFFPATFGMGRSGVPDENNMDELEGFLK